MNETVNIFDDVKCTLHYKGIKISWYASHEFYDNLSLQITMQAEDNGKWHGVIAKGLPNTPEEKLVMDALNGMKKWIDENWLGSGDRVEEKTD